MPEHHLPCQCPECVARREKRAYPRKTLHARVVDELTRDIMASYEEGSFRIPGEEVLRRRFSVSRVTIRHALSDLERNGIIYCKHGVGRFAYGRLEREQRRRDVVLNGYGQKMHATLQLIINGGNDQLKKGVEDARILLAKIREDLSPVA